MMDKIFGKSNGAERPTRLQLYSIFDMKNGQFGPPFTSFNEKEALRYFEYLSSKPGLMNHSKQDFQVYHVGAWDDATATINSVPPTALSAQ